jgi:hypothetical protein
VSLNGSGGQQPHFVLVQLVYTTLDHASNRFRKLIFDRPKRAVESILVTEVPDQINHEERIAFSASMDQLHKVFRQPVRWELNRQVFPNVVLTEQLDGNFPTETLLLQFVPQSNKGVLGEEHLCRTIGHYNQHSVRCKPL